MSLRLTILGCNSAIPTISRFTTAQVLSSESNNYLIDCGEGVQIRMNDLKIKKSKMDCIFISHLHGDHFFGLPGLITSLNLAGRTKPLTIYGPVGLQKFLKVMEEIGSFHLNFSLEVNELESQNKQLIHSDSALEVHSFPLQHRIPTTGFLFREKLKPRKIIPAKIKEHHMTITEIKAAKNGEDIARAGGVQLRNIDLTNPPEKPKAYAYCSDTIYDESVVPTITGADLLYHEATYLEELKDKARERGHSTAKEAAHIAHMAGVGKLVLGHYSSRYKDISPFLEEARSIFPASELAEDGKVFHI